MASCNAVGKRIRKALGNRGGSGVTSTIALGVDFSAGRKRREWLRQSKQSNRFAAVKTRRWRLKIISKAGGAARARKLITAGVAPSALYGVEVTGCDDSMLLQLRRTAAAAAPPRAQGRSLDVALGLSRIDPTARATAGPMVRWASEVWEATSLCSNRALGIVELRNAWRSVNPWGVQRWGDVRGPMGAAAMSAKRVGWNTADPFRWYNEEGTELHLGECSPALIKWHIESSVRRMIERRIATKTKDGALEGHRVHLEGVRKIIDTKGTDALGPAAAATLRTYSANAVWTRKRQFEASYVDSPFCEKCCREVVDTEHHRIWCCQAPEVLQERLKHACAATIQLAIEAGPLSAFFCRGLRQHPAETVPRPAEQQVLKFYRGAEIIEDRSQWTMSGDIYYDGSCSKEFDAELNRAAFSVVEVDSLGSCTAQLKGTVPFKLPRTSQAAEQCGRVAAVQVARGTSTLHGDCKGVVDAACMHAAKASHGKKMYAGCRRQADQVAAGAQIQDVKVKAHLSENVADTPEMLKHIRGNNAADTAAKDANLAHPAFGGSKIKELGDGNALFKEVCRTIANVGCLWPKPERKSRAQQATARKAGTKADFNAASPSRPHQWICIRGAMHCVRCKTFATNERTCKQRSKEECPGLCPKIAHLVMESSGHLMCATETTEGEGITVPGSCRALLRWVLHLAPYRGWQASSPRVQRCSRTSRAS